MRACAEATPGSYRGGLEARSDTNDDGVALRPARADRGAADAPAAPAQLGDERGQQLSVAATRRTIARIQELFGAHLPSPAALLSDDPGKLREAGLSWRKIGTLRDLAARLEDGRLSQDVLSGLPDDELIAELTKIPGIGPWTVQGAMLIALGREDVVLPGDLALRKAVQAAYELDHLPPQEEVLAIAEKWRPYRSLATSYLFSAAFESARAPSAAEHESS